MVITYLITISVLSILMGMSSNAVGGVLFAVCGGVFLLFAFLLISSADEEIRKKNIKTTPKRTNKVRVSLALFASIIIAAMIIYYMNSHSMSAWMTGLLIFHLTWLFYGILFTCSPNIPKGMKMFFWVGLLTVSTIFIMAILGKIGNNATNFALLMFTTIVISFVALWCTIVCYEPGTSSGKKEEDKAGVNSGWLVVATLGIVLFLGWLNKDK